MIRCLPRGICSWNYQLLGDECSGGIEMGSLAETGAVNVNNTRFSVRKHGPMSGRWTLEYNGDPLVSARKLGVFSNAFHIQDPDGELHLAPKSWFTRSFLLTRQNELVATIETDHMFTRRAKIDVHSDRWDAPVVFFAFWLSVMIFRRQQNSG